MQDNSLSISLSRAELFENDSMYRAYEEDAESRIAEGARPEAISNEEIGRGNVFLETYTVVSDAIHGGMGSVWKVHHEGWGTDLAMKRPQPRYFAEGSAERKKNSFPSASTGSAWGFTRISSAATMCVKSAAFRRSSQNGWTAEA